MKILLAINGMDLDINSLDFACSIARLTKSKLTGVFLENLEYEEIYVTENPANENFLKKKKSTALPENIEKRESCDENILRFKEACASREINCKVHRDRGVPFDELIIESRYADVLVIAPALSIGKRRNTVVPGNLARKILYSAECPVIISPEKTEPIEEILFAYDGEASSVYAMKQFAYLFPSMHDKKATIIEVTDKEPVLTEKYKINEWLTEHFDNAELYGLTGDEQNRLLETVFVKRHTMIVMGAYGRKKRSYLFQKSHAESIMRLSNQPIFIAHC